MPCRTEASAIILITSGLPASLARVKAVSPSAVWTSGEALPRSSTSTASLSAWSNERETEAKTERVMSDRTEGAEGGRCSHSSPRA
eukprot:scaffold437_cov168-Ochromonas_danica.AAC.61